MSNLSKEIIEASMNKRPLDVEELFNQAIREECQRVVAECEIEYTSIDETDEILDEDAELQEFFKEFNELYGHLSEEEQLAILSEFEETLDEENPDPATSVNHINEPSAGEYKPHQKPEGSSPGGVHDTGEMSSKDAVKKKQKTLEVK